MEIIIGKFKLVSVENRFDVVEQKEVETTDQKTRLKTGEVRTVENIVCYDMRLESAIRYVIDRTINDQALSVDLPTYLDMYKKELNKITNLLK